MASSIDFFDNLDMGKSVLLTDNMFGDVMSEFFENTEVIYSSGSIIIHSIAKESEVYTLTDSGSEKILSRIV
ncbi:hypothetical protein [Xenorhabdus bovienii]|uniref:hypothetical protein n=1 Tax=Xenorhabdus bovienii TaxID=40576 RepID=UPI0023B261C7|nr:hypothetical protein [Xenorhabdus bovienii]MDE9454552.1 hypothetical protein [Xenorhabdus bovienii]MDE9568794.1 hypothetical protein [Xenorhabdus bovienii]